MAVINTFSFFCMQIQRWAKSSLRELPVMTKLWSSIPTLGISCWQASLKDPNYRSNVNVLSNLFLCGTFEARGLGRFEIFGLNEWDRFLFSPYYSRLCSFKGHSMLSWFPSVLQWQWSVITHLHVITSIENEREGWIYFYGPRCQLMLRSNYTWERPKLNISTSPCFIAGEPEEVSSVVWADILGWLQARIPEFKGEDWW